MSLHWSVLMERSRSVLARSGADVEQDRDYLVATWTVAPDPYGRMRDATFRVIVGPGRVGEPPEVEEIELDGLYRLQTEESLRAIAPVLTSAVAALDEIAALHRSVP